MPRVRPRRECNPASFLRYPPVGGRILKERIDRGNFNRVVLRPHATLTAKGRDAALRRDPGARQRQTAASSGEQIGGSPDRHASVCCAAAKTDCCAYRCPCVSYDSRAASVGICTHCESRPSRIALTFKTRNFSADLPLS